MGRILRKIVGRDSLAKLMLMIGFDYEDALLIEGVVEQDPVVPPVNSFGRHPG